MSSKTFNPDDIQEFAEIDLYKYLALTKESFTPSKAKTQFRKFILKYHPDRNPNDVKAAKKFQLIEASYRILSNSAARAHYDKLYDSAQLSDDEDVDDMRDVDRSIFTKLVAPTKQEQATLKAKMRQKNLDLDPSYYDKGMSGKMSDADATSQMADMMRDRNACLVDSSLQDKFKADLSIIDGIDDKEAKQKKFNEMFETGRKKPVKTQAIVAHTLGHNSSRNCALATVNQTETMFSDVNDIDEAFALGNHELDEDEEEYDETNFAAYEQRYLAGLQDDGDMSKLAMGSTLKHGRADFTFDDNR